MSSIFSAYLKSSFITKLHGEAQLDLAEMNQLLNTCIEEAQQTVKAYFRDRAAERGEDGGPGMEGRKGLPL